MSEVFISYERSGEAAAAKVADALRAAGHSVWSDAQLPAHRAYATVIEERLAAADAVVVLWSRAAEKSEWVRAEAEFAREHGKLVQVVVDDSLPPMPFNQTQCASLKDWRGDRRNPQWRKVLESLDQLARSRAGGAATAAIAGAPDGGQATPPPAAATRRLPRPMILALAGLVIVAVAGAAWFGWNATQRRGGEARTVVMPFKALSADPAAAAFAREADSEIGGKLSENQFLTLTKSRAAEADFAVDGTVQGGDGRLRVRVRLDDPHAGVTLWSTEFVRPSSDAAGLRDEIGWRLVDVMTSAAVARQDGRVRLPAAELGLFIQARDALAASDVEPAPLLAELIRRAPDFAPAHAMMCMHDLSAARVASAGEFAPRRDRALAECRKAADLDPRLGLPRRGLSYGEDGRQWARRERLLRPAGNEPSNPDLEAALGEFLAATGRQDEGITLLQHAVAAKKGWTIYSSNLAYALFTSDRTDEAHAFIARRLALRPQDSDVRFYAFLEAAYRGEPAEALALMNDPDRRPVLPPVLVQAYRAFLAARSAAEPAAREAAITTILDTVGSASLWRPHAVAMLAALGDLDGAFRQANLYATDPVVLRFGYTLQPGFLFGPNTAQMRADPRFIPLVRTLGLLDYWRASGDWPDFCAREPKSVCARMQHGA